MYNLMYRCISTPEEYVSSSMTSPRYVKAHRLTTGDTIGYLSRRPICPDSASAPQRCPNNLCTTSAQIGNRVYHVELISIVCTARIAFICVALCGADLFTFCTLNGFVIGFMLITPFIRFLNSEFNAVMYIRLA